MNTVVIGSNGQLGRHVFETFKKKKNFFFFSSSNKKSQFIYGNLNQIKILLNKISKIKPKIIINCSAFTEVDKAENQKKEARMINSSSIKTLSQFCYKNKIFLIHFSTDYVYSGSGNKPWDENSKSNPINFYGLTKKLGEQNIVKSKCNFIILRVSWLYGLYGKNNFVVKIFKNIKSNKKLFIVDDQVGSPTNTDLVIKVLKKILANINKKKKISGIFNLCPKGFVDRYNLSHFILKNSKKKRIYKFLKIQKIKTKDLQLMARRPLNSRMNINKISNYLNIEIKSWKYYLKNYLINLN